MKRMCPITSCSLMAKGCAVPYKNNNIRISDIFPYKLTAKIDDPSGWEDEICLQCSNGE